jgi:uncharacterized Zn-binding protein involved in type VI secretion
MSLTTIVNGLTVVHAQSNGTAVQAPPDVCLTPSPGGPVPIPYPNVAASKDLVKGSSTVSVDGLPIALSDSEFVTSTGDEAGTAGGGVVSHVIKGKAKFINFSMDVMVEGKNVCRLTDPMTLNGNAPNTTCAAEVQGNLAVLGPNVAVLCTVFCWCDQAGAKGKDVIQISRFKSSEMA